MCRAGRITPTRKISLESIYFQLSVDHVEAFKNEIMLFQQVGRFVLPNRDRTDRYERFRRAIRAMHLVRELDPSFKSDAFDTLLLEGSIICFLPNPSMDEGDHCCREKTCFSLDKPLKIDPNKTKVNSRVFNCNDPLAHQERLHPTAT